MKAVFSLVYLNGFAPSHTSFTYAMFSKSMKMAKRLGYEIVLFGNAKTILLLDNLCDTTYDVATLKFHFYDDIKIHIWKTLAGNDYFTIDGDVFLSNKLDFTNKEVSLYCDSFEETISDEAIHSLNHFNKLNPNLIISEWNINNIKNLNTGIIKWNDEEFKNYFIQSYNKLREFYLKNTSYLNKNELLMVNRSVSSHILFENLLYQLLENKNKSYKELSDSNSYIHLSGSDKFSNQEIKNMIYLDI